MNRYVITLLFIFAFLTVVSKAEDCGCTEPYPDELAKRVHQINASPQYGTCQAQGTTTVYSYEDPYEFNGGIRYTLYAISCGTCEEPDEPLSIDASLWQISTLPQKNSCGVPDDYDLQGECQSLGGQVFSEKIKCCSISTCFLPVEPEPDCPPDQYNATGDIEVPDCQCKNGMPKINGECQTPTCPTENGGLPLVAENITEQFCQNYSNPVLGVVASYIAYNDGYNDISCCYSDSPAEPDECPPNHIKNSFGICEPIPPTADNNDTDNNETDNPCLDGFVWHNNQCLLPEQVNPENNETDNNGNSSGDNNGNSSGDSGNSSNGISPEDGNESNSTMQFLYDDNLVNEMINNNDDFIKGEYSIKVNEIFTSLREIHTVNIPFNPSCGCDDPTFEFDFFGKHYSKNIELCTPFDTILEYTKPVIWFLVILGLIFHFYRRM
jgi:hypothetical protein